HQRSGFQHPLKKPRPRPLPTLMAEITDIKFINVAHHGPPAVGPAAVNHRRDSFGNREISQRGFLTEGQKHAHRSNQTRGSRSSPLGGEGRGEGGMPQGQTRGEAAIPSPALDSRHAPLIPTFSPQGGRRSAPHQVATPRITSRLQFRRNPP